MTELLDVLFEIDTMLSAADIDHAFGGALALGFYAEPRGTRDVDLAVATSLEGADDLLQRFSNIGFRCSIPKEEWLPMAGIRLDRAADDAIADVFLSFDPYHRELLSRSEAFPLLISNATAYVRFLSASDVALLKLSFNRPKDWLDVQAMIDFGTTIDFSYVEHWLIAFRGPNMHPRLHRLRLMLEETRPQ
jgi:hypothetical protein